VNLLTSRTELSVCASVHCTSAAKFSGVTLGWLLRLVTGGPTGRRTPTVAEFLVINFNVFSVCY